MSSLISSAPHRRSWWAVAVLGTALALSAGTACGGDSEGQGEDAGARLCSPGTNVVCRCANLQVGTKRCNDSGTAYETECMLNGSAECPGGELPDPGSSSGASSGATGTVDACPGRLVAVAPGVPVKLTGNTAGALDRHHGAEGACAGTLGPAEHVFQVAPTARGELSFKIKSGRAEYTPALYVRRGDCAEGEQLACVVGDTESSSPLRVRADESYWLFVDGMAGQVSNGPYEVELSLTDGTFCGDGVVDPGEVCDDGNTTDGDGCSADCRRVDGNPSSATRCPGQPVHLWVEHGGTGGKGSTSSAKLVGAQNTFSTLAQQCSFAGPDTNPSNDHLYELIPHGSGEVLIEVTASSELDPRVSLWSACEPENEAALIDCGFPATSSGRVVELPSQSSQSIRLEDGKRYTLVVDGHRTVGDYELTLVY